MLQGKGESKSSNDFSRFHISLQGAGEVECDCDSLLAPVLSTVRVIFLEEACTHDKHHAQIFFQ